MKTHTMDTAYACKPDRRKTAAIAPRAVYYSVGESDLGLTLLAANERGICAILIGDARDFLREELAAAFPRSARQEAPTRLSRLQAAVGAFIAAPSRGLNQTLDLTGTAFQERVWKALHRIPAGRTLSYVEVARDIGQPTAARAVGRACAANFLAVAIPCHRVLGKGGSISGYRWGVARKRELLLREKQPC